MTFARLYTHPFFQSASDAVKPQIEQSLRSMGDLFSDERSPPRQYASDDEGPYEWRVFRRQVALVSRLQHADEARRHLGWTPTLRQLASANTDESSWIEYHFANFVVLLADSPDLALLLINEAFELGVSPRQATRTSICGNRWVRNSPTAHAYDALANQVTSLREARNLHLHRGQSPRPDSVLGSNDFLMVTVGTMLARVSNSSELEKQSRKLTRAQGRTLALRLSTDIERVTGGVYDLFSALAPIFLDRPRRHGRAPA